MKTFLILLLASVTVADICQPLEYLWMCDHTSSPSVKPKTITRGDSGMVLSYRKKTCQQLVKAGNMNETTRAAALNKMKSAEIDFESFDAKNDEYLNKDISEGMQLLWQQ